MKIIKRLIIVGMIALIISPGYAGKKGTSAWGIKLSSPQLLSVSKTFYPEHLWLVQLEPGIGGGKLNIGLGANYRYTIGIAFKASLLQTWLAPIGGVKANQTYLGGEFEIMWRGVNLTVGQYSHLSGNDSRRDMILSVGLGIGF